MYNVRKIEENINICGEFRGRILYDEPLAEKTTFKVGGNAAIFIQPKDFESMKIALTAIEKAGIPFVVLGGGSNVVIPDEGIKYAVVNTSDIDFIDFDESKSVLRCGAGCSIKSIIDFCFENHLGGLEKFSGLPGSIGGATFMNARCYDYSISDVFVSANYISSNTKSCDLNDNSECKKYSCYVYNKEDWDYKKSPFQTYLSDCIILSVELSVKKIDNNQLEQMKCDIEKYFNDRVIKGHFKFPSAGSVFKNNRNFGKPSGQIIDEVNLKGFSIGDAQVAPWHGNFIINKGCAKSKDIKDLVNYISNVVYKKNGFKLEYEIIFIESVK